MPVARQKWPYLQVADDLAGQIASGRLAEGTRLPPLQVIAADWGVSHQTAHRAMALLRTRKLITTTREGSWVGAPREVPGPQQLLAGIRFPHADRLTVTAAELVPAPEYIVPILGVRPYGPGGVAWVIRREQVSYGPDDSPRMLMVQWFPGSLAGPVPALLAPAPLPPGEALALIGEGAGRHVTRWEVSWETRQIFDDGREGPLLHLDAGAYIQAITITWQDDRMRADGEPEEQDMIEYTEYDLLPGLVTTAAGTVTPAGAR